MNPAASAPASDRHRAAMPLFHLDRSVWTLEGAATRFSGANREANDKLVAGLQGLAARWGITPSQLAIRWVLGKQPQLVPTLGVRTIQQLDKALAAKPLTAEQPAEVEALAPRVAIAGTHYPAAMMNTLDSEKR